MPRMLSTGCATGCLSFYAPQHSLRTCTSIQLLQFILTQFHFLSSLTFINRILLLLLQQSSLGQVPETHFLHHSLSPAIHFIFTYCFYFSLFCLLFFSLVSFILFFLFSPILFSLFTCSILLIRIRILIVLFLVYSLTANK